jgi:hypothetical protein
METVDGMNLDGVAVVSDRNVSSRLDHLFTDDDLEAMEKSDPGQEEPVTPQHSISEIPSCLLIQFFCEPVNSLLA